MGAWAPWDYIISYIGIAALALMFMQMGHKRAMDKLTKVYDDARRDQLALTAALQSLVLILEAILQKEREKK